jgi:hypothetical protein
VLQDGVEALGEVGDDMVVVERLAVVGVEGGRGAAADEDGAGDERLEAGGLLQDLVEGRCDKAMLSDQITATE